MLQDLWEKANVQELETLFFPERFEDVQCSRDGSRGNGRGLDMQGNGLKRQMRCRSEQMRQNAGNDAVRTLRRSNQCRLLLALG